MKQRFVRRNRVDERIALGVAAAGALVAVFGDAEPTGATIPDALVVFVSVGAVVWASSSATWWALASASGISALLAFHPVGLAAGGLAFLGGLDVGTWRRDQTIKRSIIGAVTTNVLIRSELDGFFGLSALVGLSVGVALFVIGVQRRPSRIRRIAWKSLAATGGFVFLALLAAGIAGVSARPDVTNGARTARQGIVILNDGDYEGAAQLFDEAASQFERAEGRLGGVLAMPGHAVPALGQNLRAGSDLSAAAADATAEAAAALNQIDTAALRLRDGRVDLDAVRSAQTPLVRVDAALARLRGVVGEVESGWLLGAVQDELKDLNDDLNRNQPRLVNAINAVRLAPQILGEEQLRRYLMLFTTPSEARGLGGFVGSYAVLEVEEGALRVSEFGRTGALSAPTAGADCSSCPADLLLKYGPYGFTTGPDGTVGKVLYSNVTMPAHFPYIAESIAVLYPQATGDVLDGVIVVDPHAVEALMQYSGPIEVPELDATVQPDDAAEFILTEQYIVAQDKGVRIEALESLASGAISAILRGDLPEPPVIARDLGPLIAERRLLMWTSDLEEQALFDRIGLLGSIPPLDPNHGGFSVSVNNGSANKIDAFLDRSTDVRIESTPTGRQLVADVVLTNNAPQAGLPSYVIGNQVGLPDGYSRILVTFYGPNALDAASLDGENLPLQVLPEAGWTTYSAFVDLAPGQQRAFRLVFDISPGSVPDATPTVWEQPLADRT